MELPSVIAIKSVNNSKYLRFVHEDGEIHGFLQFSGEEVVTPYTKLEVEPAKTGDGLVHIRCCYNNKYFVRCSEKESWIIDGANEPEEDTSKWSCTLFKPFFVDEDGDEQRIRLMHVQLGHYVSLLKNAAAPFTDCLGAGSPDPDDDDLSDIFTIFNWRSIFVLPEYVAFKGDNDRYLQPLWFRRRGHLQFSATDIADPGVIHRVRRSSDGSIFLWSQHWSKYWRRADYWILVDADSNTGNATSFWPIKFGDNLLALRIGNNNHFCYRFSRLLRKDLLYFYVTSITQEARLQVVEPVLLRRISDVIYNLSDARIYNQTIRTFDSETLVNRTQQPIERELTFSYTDKTSTSWNASVSSTLGVTVSFSAGVPLINGGGGIEVSAQIQRDEGWGETIERTEEKTHVFRVTVRPMSRLIARIVGTTASIDVPFSYVKRDVLTDGTINEEKLSDGIFSGMNSFDIDSKFDEEPL